MTTHFRLSGSPSLCRALVLAALSLAPASPMDARAQGASMTLGGFIDAYYAWDTGRPADFRRAYTLQTARHGEFNINLAFIDLELTGDNVRGRLALQAGTSVGANHAAERVPFDSTPNSLAQHVQEAVIGLRLGDRTWIDGGIFFTHTGTEKWISRDNATYTRSLISEFTPYHLAGLKMSHQLFATFTATAVVVNGWQNITENNVSKSFGGRLEWQATRRIALGYYNLIGNEQPDTGTAAIRYYNGLTGSWTGSELSVKLAIDGGRQDTPDVRAASWWGATLLGRLQVMEHWAVTGRVETFEDPDKVLIVTGGDAFRAWGTSVGLDMEHPDGLAWRTEFRTLRSKDLLFPQHDAAGGLSRTNYLFVTSFAVTF